MSAASPSVGRPSRMKSHCQPRIPPAPSKDRQSAASGPAMTWLREMPDSTTAYGMVRRSEGKKLRRQCGRDRGYGSRCGKEDMGRVENEERIDMERRT